MLILHRPQNVSSLFSPHDLFPEYYSINNIWTMNNPIITRSSYWKVEDDKNVGGTTTDEEKEFGHAELSDIDKKYIYLTIDVPGCKASDLSLEFDPDKEILEISAKRKKRKNDLTILKEFSKKFSLPENSIDNSNLKASILDGILTIKIAKSNLQNESKVWDVPVVPKDYDSATITAPQSNCSREKTLEEEETTMEMDLPGVKADDVTVKFHNQSAGCIQVLGKRKNGDKIIKTYKGHFEVNKRKLDTTKLKAFISDGVLTIAAPIKKRKIEKKRVIPVDNAIVEETTTADLTPLVVVTDESNITKDEDTKDQNEVRNKSEKIETVESNRATKE